MISLTKLTNPFTNFLPSIRQPFPPVVRTLATPKSLLWTLIQASVNLCHRDPYILLLKHHDWVKKEIEQLEHADVIEKNLSPWASPIVTVPKKSGPGEPPKRRMCVDYHCINALQTKVDSSSRGCMSLYPLLKIDKMFAKLCIAKIFTTLDLHSGYYHNGLTDEVKPKTAFVTPHSSGISTWCPLV